MPRSRLHPLQSDEDGQGQALGHAAVPQLIVPLLALPAVNQEHQLGEHAGRTETNTLARTPSQELYIRTQKQL